MSSGPTRLVESSGSSSPFLERHRVVLIIVSGGAEGTEFELDRSPFVVGRSSGADLHFEDTALSKQHAIFEADDEGFRLRDLDSTNGTRLNGASISAADLKHGDRIEMGQHVFQYVVEPRSSGPRTYEIE